MDKKYLEFSKNKCLKPCLPYFENLFAIKQTVLEYVKYKQAIPIEINKQLTESYKEFSTRFFNENTVKCLQKQKIPNFIKDIKDTKEIALENKKKIDELSIVIKALMFTTINSYITILDMIISICNDFEQKYKKYYSKKNVSK